MKRFFTQSFKIQAVEKALNRSASTTLSEVAIALNIGASTLNKWMVKARNQEFEMVSSKEIDRVTHEKRPHEWSAEERLNMVGKCASLDDESINTLCREMGIYPHHVEQWKLDFIKGSPANNKADTRSEVKTLKHENKTLKKEINRKDRALAETAALLVLQKKVQEIWGRDEDN
jgi:transposase